jgi:hypothetical protein
VPPPGEPEVIMGALPIGWIWQFLRAARLRDPVAVVVEAVTTS